MLSDNVHFFLFLTSALFSIGIVGVYLNRHNIVVILMSIELILLAASTNFIVFSSFLIDISGQIFVFFILSVSAAEVAIGLAIILNMYRCMGSINTEKIANLRG